MQFQLILFFSIAGVEVLNVVVGLVKRHLALETAVVVLETEVVVVVALVVTAVSNCATSLMS